MRPQTTKYGNWLNLNSHLLWGYDQEINTDSKEVDRYANNGAWLVREGWAQVRHDGKVFRAEPGQWLIVKPTHRYQLFAKGTVLLSLSFDAHWPDGTKFIDEGLSLIVDAADYPMLEKRAKPMVTVMKRVGIAPRRWDMREKRVDAFDFFAIERHLNFWFTELLKVLNAHEIYPSGHFGVDERIARAIQIMNDSLVGGNLDMHKLADQVGISLVHLTRLFQREMHASPKKYFETMRLDYALGRLNQPGVRVNEVASALGYDYESSFTHWFKRHTGLSPKEYINRQDKSFYPLF